MDRILFLLAALVIVCLLSRSTACADDPIVQTSYTADMANFTDLGSVMSATDFTWGEANTARAAQCIERNGSCIRGAGIASETAQHPSPPVSPAAHRAARSSCTWTALTTPSRASAPPAAGK